MKVTEFKFVKDWVVTQSSIIRNIFPTVEKEEINQYLEAQATKKLINTQVQLHNNYLHQELDTTLLEVVDWIDDKEPICAGFGMFFKNQHKAANPNAQMILNFLDLRKVFKNLLKQYLETSYEYATADRKQMTEKVNVNAFYGCNGAVVSRFYNIFTASSVTLTGQSLISTTAQAFEAFLANNVLYYDLDNCLEFIHKVLNEKYETKLKFMPSITVDAVYDRLVDTFYDFKPEYEGPLFTLLLNLDQTQLNKLYFKNNLYEFCRIPAVSGIICEMFEDTQEFMSPEVVPVQIKDRLEAAWKLISDWVFYNHSPIGRIDRLKTHTRKSVVIVDTDSNMINLDPWVQFICDEIVPGSDDLSSREYDNIRFIAINMLCTFLTDMINSVLRKYTKTSNVPKDYRGRIHMKNEYLFTKMITTRSKKRYIGSIRLREGKEIFPEKLDIKGLDFMKSSTREDTMQTFKKIIAQRLIAHESIDLLGALEDLKSFEKSIVDSLESGEKTYLNPENVKEPEAYANPYRMQGFRAVMAWNIAYPEKQIGLPEKIDVVKLNINSIEDLAPLEDLEPEIYHNLIDNLLEGPDEELKAKGLTVIAIPRNEKKIPDWIIPFIDIELIANKNLSQFTAVLESMGVASVKIDDKTFFTNIKKIG